MQKRRIVIADPDMDYVMNLVKKFAEDYQDMVELELITDKGYLDVFLRTPQSADLLIVGESFYKDTVNRHSFRNILILAETREESYSRNARIFRVYKYTAVREIFNVIYGREMGLFHATGGKADQTRIVFFHSASGGTGKTSLALGLCERLTAEHKAVLYLDAESLQSFQIRFRESSPIQEQRAYISLMHEDSNHYEAVRDYIRHESFDYLPPFKAACGSLGLPLTVFESIVLQAKEAGDYDYIVVDSDHSFTEENARLAGLADYVMLVIKPYAQSVFAFKNYLSNINDYNTEKYICICNDCQPDEMNVFSQDEGFIREYIEHIDCGGEPDINDFSQTKGITGLSLFIQ